jgi:hypothetical protein
MQALIVPNTRDTAVPISQSAARLKAIEPRNQAVRMIGAWLEVCASELARLPLHQPPQYDHWG